MSSIHVKFCAHENLEGLNWDHRLVEEMRSDSLAENQSIGFYVPDFIRYESSEISHCQATPWPAFSITAGECKLQCDHCRAEILKPMNPVRSPDQLKQKVDQFVSMGARGMLLSGGSNHRNEVEYEPYYRAIRTIKDEYPEFQVSVHTGLVSHNAAKGLEQSGVDIAMMDVIGSRDTISQVYHLKRPVSAFAESLSALKSTTMKIVPHIVLGLHYGNLLGEWHALDIVKSQGVDALVLVVLNPMYATKERPFRTPNPHAIGRFFIEARKALPDTRILLGCARPHGVTRRLIDAYAVMAGLNGIAHPAEGIVALATELGRSVNVNPGCCATIAHELAAL